MVAALKRHRTKSVMFLGGTTLTGGEVVERISQYVQAFEALGAGFGTTAALLALNRPEVLFILGAGQTQGYRRTSLHPLGSLDDHAYVLNDAEITTLIIDPVPMFVERALGLLAKVPNLTQVLTIGPVPDELAHVGTDFAAAAETSRPCHSRRCCYRRTTSCRSPTLGHDRQAQGCHRHHPGDVDHVAGAAHRVGVAGVAALLDVYAALARGRCLLRADGDQGWLPRRPHTGDVPREDEDGFWYIVDRTKDMIVTGGSNVFPREVEDVTAKHPAVAQVGVIGVPDERWGEAVTAVVVLRDGAELTDEVVQEIKDAVRERKGALQSPKQVIAIAALPLTGLVKPDKKALRAQFSDDGANCAV